MKKKKDESPNAEIDEAISALLKRANDTAKPEPTDVVVKVLTAAIAWEKVKHNIKDVEPFDPDSM